MTTDEAMHYALELQNQIQYFKNNYTSKYQGYILENNKI